MPSDLDCLVDLIAAFYAESSIPLDRVQARTAFGELLDDPRNGRVWIVEREGRTLGYAVLTLGYAMEYYGRDAFLDDLYLVPEARGEGVGTVVMEAVEREAHALGVRALHLEVGRDNHRARTLYARRGFQDNDRQLLTKRL